MKSGKETAVLKRWAYRDAEAPLCFSIITKTRSLDLSAAVHAIDGWLNSVTTDSCCVSAG